MKVCIIALLVAAAGAAKVVPQLRAGTALHADAKAEPQRKSLKMCEALQFLYSRLIPKDEIIITFL